ncbi:MAG: AAA family ATPase [Flavisolibacter sp.]
MKLIERDGTLNHLQAVFEKVEQGQGHCVFIYGEAGIGKTSLVREFTSKVKKRANVYQGTCDALFTPRPLAPLYDVLLQLQDKSFETNSGFEDRYTSFNRFFYEIKCKSDSCVVIFEDIHWADESTLDFIKFFSRRITQLKCLFLLTYRDMEVHSQHSLTNVFGQLDPDSSVRLQLLPLSKSAVEKMAGEKGYKGEDVYAISGGNPFYVNEILASYSLGVPDNIRNLVLSIYNRLEERNKNVWQILSVLPAAFEIRYLEAMDPSYAANIHSFLDLKIVVINDGLISFKHELFRRTIESSLSPFLRIELNKRILYLLRESFEKNGEIERIIHHAKAANEHEIVVKYAPVAAKQAIKLGAHLQASKLYLAAIEYYQGREVEALISFYEPYAYECYLSSQIEEAIIYTGKLIQLLEKRRNTEKESYSLQLLSRLWWLKGNKINSERCAVEAINLLVDEPASATKAMAFSCLSELKMHSDETEECISWGKKAMEMARQAGDQKALCHALNNVGTALSRTQSMREEGFDLLKQALEIASGNSFEDEVARAYANLGSSALIMKNYSCARKYLEKGIEYVEEKDLNTWPLFLRAKMSRFHLEKGAWDKAAEIAERVINDGVNNRIGRTEAFVVLAKIKMRTGSGDPLPFLLEAKEIAIPAPELSDIIHVLVAMLEYEWITGQRLIEDEIVDLAVNRAGQNGNILSSEFAFWLWKVRKLPVRFSDFYEGYPFNDSGDASKAAVLWNSIGCPYEQALMLFQGDYTSKIQALDIVDKLGARITFDKMKRIMMASGFRRIPRGIRRTTRANSANLTLRELDVLLFLKEGLQNKEIADRLFISSKTVENHISSILFKLDVNSRIKAVRQALELELIQ